MKKIDIDISSCKLKNIDFLKHFSNLNGSSLCFAYNRIKDISVLSKIEHSDGIFLRDNLIKDISPLSNLKTISCLDLSENKISDISPLKNIEKIDELWIQENKFNDINTVIEFIKKKRPKNYNY